MNLADAQRLARTLMDAHGLADWRLELDHARRRAGACRHPRRTISLSAQLIPLYPEETVRGVVLHEIAHARVGAAHGHDAVWKREARRLGAPDAARLPGSLPAPAAPWVGTCPRCGAQRRLFAAPRRVVACGACARDFRPDLVLTWTHEGVPARPGGAYARELARLIRGGRP